MTHLTGDFSHAVQLSAEVLAVAGRIYPSTRANVSLEAILADGTRVKGETCISRSTSRIERVVLSPRRARPLSETLEAMECADLITLGPGSLFTSVVPNLLVEGIPRAMAGSRAVKAYFMNLMTQPGETSGFRASDHLQALRDHAGRFAHGLVDVCVVNSGSFAGRVVKQYGAREARPVEIDRERLEAMGVRVVQADLLRASGRARTPAAKIRHDSGSLGAIAVELARERDAQRTRARSKGKMP